MKNFYPVIMAGGRGGRFWPMGRKKNPKQLLPLTGERSMLRETVDRLEGLSEKDHILIMTNSDIAEKVRCQLPDLPEENIIVEPEGRDTAPCIALAAAKLYTRDPDSVMCIMPSDHVITPVEIFQSALLKAGELAQSQESLITLGIPVTMPATGYGYIKLGEKLTGDFHKIAEFKEKPTAEAAARFMASGSYLWNSGIFIWKSSVILKEFETFQPEMYKVIRQWLAGADFRESFRTVKKISIDYAILEKTAKAVVCRAPFRWNDIGSWKVLKEFREGNAQGNVQSKNVYTLDSSGNLILCDDDSAVAVIGLSNIAVIKSADGILVCSLDAEQKVKELIQEMPEKYQ
ncbi:MAG: mannose-1-phosphate guanylyltransferase [Lentisphaeria bacterium]|nr:mannose-1-phosphate guanylyltransferase [Lentisphaeria bacterium]